MKHGELCRAKNEPHQKARVWTVPGTPFVIYAWLRADDFTHAPLLTTERAFDAQFEIVEDTPQERTADSAMADAASPEAPSSLRREAQERRA